MALRQLAGRAAAVLMVILQELQELPGKVIVAAQGIILVLAQEHLAAAAAAVQAAAAEMLLLGALAQAVQEAPEQQLAPV